MTDKEMNAYRKKLGAFFYPFLANVELKNISAVENTEKLIDTFIAFNANGHFAQTYLTGTTSPDVDKSRQQTITGR